MDARACVRVPLRACMRALQRSFAEIVCPNVGGGEGSSGADSDGAAWEAAFDSEEEDEEDSDDGMVVDSQDRSVATEQLRTCCEALHLLGWLSLIEPTLSAMLHSRLHASLVQRCADRWDTPMLTRVLSWLRRGVTPWLKAVLMPIAPPDAPPSAALLQKLAGLRFFLMESLATLRIHELFDLIVDYPDSLPALTDLRESVDASRHRTRGRRASRARTLPSHVPACCPEGGWPRL